MKALKQTVRKYYKYTDTTWTQPTLSANGNVSGNYYACYSVNNTYGQAYQAFDNNTSNSVYRYGSSASACDWELVFYSPYPLKVSQISITNNTDSPALPIVNYKIYGSNNNTTWEELASGTNTNTTLGGTWNITITTAKYYKYIKLKALTGTQYNSSRYYAQLSEMSITASQGIITESTSSDYDFYKDVDEYSCYKSGADYYAFNI